MNNSQEDNELTYVSPADFDEPGESIDDIKAKDEADLPVLEAVINYLNKEIAKSSHVDSLTASDDTAEMTLEQRWAVQREIARKLGLIKTSIEAVIEGIEEKYDETQ